MAFFLECTWEAKDGMRKPRGQVPSWRIESKGQAIETLEQWKTLAKPKSATHWKPGRSAFECASAWFNARGKKTIPAELRALLDSCSNTTDAEVTLVLPEHRVRFDNLPGEPRNADVNVLVEGSRGRVALSIEAKADETFGARVEDVLNAAVDKLCRDEPTNAVLRVQQLARAILGAHKWERLPLGDIRYQLLTGLAGAIAFANEVDASTAIFVVHEFVTEHTTDERHLENLRDLNAFTQRVTRGRQLGVPCGGVVGPIQYPGSPLFAHDRRPALYLAKVRRVSRPSRALGLFGADYRRLETAREAIPSGKDWRKRFDAVTPDAAGEGGTVYFADEANGYFVITSEAALAEFLEPGEPTEFVRRFESAAAREVWCAERFARLAVPQSDVS